MLIIAVMNGTFGFRWLKRVKKRKYMSDVVWEVWNDCYMSSNDAFYEAFVNHEVKIESWRGSLMYKPAVERFILKHNKPGNNLLLIGKSKGGYWINEIAKQLENRLEYDKKRLILADPCWVGRDKKNIVPPTTFDHIYNFFQKNEIFLNGAWWSKKDLLPFDSKSYTQKELTDCNHWTIIEAAEVRQAIRESIEELI